MSIPEIVTILHWIEPNRDEKIFWIPGLNLKRFDGVYIGSLTKPWRELGEFFYGRDMRGPFRFQHREISKEELPERLREAMLSGKTVHFVTAGETP